jgi:hypothetical protein
MRSYFLLLLVVCISACAELSRVKVGSDGLYRFKEHPLVVRAPDSCLLDMAVQEAKNSVDFTTGKGYWMASGQYAVQAYLVPGDIQSGPVFIEKTKEFVPTYMAKDRASMGLTFAVKEEKQLEVNGKPSYQVIGTAESGTALLVATHTLHKTRITIASLLYPLKSGTSFKDQIPWQCYNSFVASVQEQ